MIQPGGFNEWILRIQWIQSKDDEMNMRSRYDNFLFIFAKIRK